jgi:preprotein translocase subunit SecY
MQEFMGQDNGGSLLNLLNLFSGGALEQVSIFALGVTPYVSASIIFQLLTSIFKPLEELRKEGEMGQRKINQYTRYATIGLALVQGFSIALYLEGCRPATWSRRARQGLGLPHPRDAHPRHRHGLHHVAGRADHRARHRQRHLADHLRGHRRGLPLAARRPGSSRTGQIQPTSLLIAGVLVIASVMTIVFFERGQRRIPIEYSRRIIGRKMYGGQRTHLPLRVNSSGVIPPIFASTGADAARQLADCASGDETPARPPRQRGDWVYNTLFVVLTVFFCYFYTSVTFPPVDVADNLKKQGAFIPNIRPGKATADYIEKVLMRITFGGALYVAVDLRAAGLHAAVPQGPVPLRRHLDHDRGRRGPRHGQPDRVVPDLAALRGLRGPHGAAHPGSEGDVNDLVFIGPPGAGKGTQAQRLVREARRPADLHGRHAPRCAQGRHRARSQGRRVHVRGALVPTRWSSASWRSAWAPRRRDRVRPRRLPAHGAPGRGARPPSGPHGPGDRPRGAAGGARRADHRAHHRRRVGETSGRIYHSSMIPPLPRPG